MSAEDTKNSPKVPRRVWGRRKVDWMVPLILFIVALLAGLWAIDNYSKAQQLRQINTALDAQSKLLDRLLAKGDEERAQTRPAGSQLPATAPVPIASPSPTGLASPIASPSPVATLPSPTASPALIIENATPDSEAVPE